MWKPRAGAFAHAAEHRDFQLGLQFLMAWPALPDASRMIEARKADIEVDAAEAELWAAKLRRPSDGVTSRSVIGSPRSPRRSSSDDRHSSRSFGRRAPVAITAAGCPCFPGG
jgi:hypothetical protein